MWTQEEKELKRQVEEYKELREELLRWHALALSQVVVSSELLRETLEAYGIDSRVIKQ